MYKNTADTDSNTKKTQFGLRNQVGCNTIEIENDLQQEQIERVKNLGNDNVDRLESVNFKEGEKNQTSEIKTKDEPKVDVARLEKEQEDILAMMMGGGDSASSNESFNSGIDDDEEQQSNQGGEGEDRERLEQEQEDLMAMMIQGVEEGSKKSGQSERTEQNTTENDPEAGADVAELERQQLEMMELMMQGVGDEDGDGDESESEKEAEIEDLERKQEDLMAMMMGGEDTDSKSSEGLGFSLNSSDESEKPKFNVKGSEAEIGFNSGNKKLSSDKPGYNVQVRDRGLMKQSSNQKRRKSQVPATFLVNSEEEDGDSQEDDDEDLSFDFESVRKKKEEGTSYLEVGASERGLGRKRKISENLEDIDFLK